jgi:hypothetical protein
MSEEQDDLHPKQEPSRALVPVEPEGEAARSGAARPLATFIAQMLACRARLPDFRVHRRAEAPDAAALYGAAPVLSRPRQFERVL